MQLCYLPYDLPWTAARFLDCLQPKLAVVMETGSGPAMAISAPDAAYPWRWPARLSERSARGYSIVSPG